MRKNHFYHLKRCWYFDVILSVWKRQNGPRTCFTCIVFSSSWYFFFLPPISTTIIFLHIFVSKNKNWIVILNFKCIGAQTEFQYIKNQKILIGILFILQNWYKKYLLSYKISYIVFGISKIYLSVSMKIILAFDFRGSNVKFLHKNYNTTNCLIISRVCYNESFLFLITYLHRTLKQEF